MRISRHSMLPPCFVIFVTLSIIVSRAPLATAEFMLDDIIVVSNDPSGVGILNGRSGNDLSGLPGLSYPGFQTLIGGPSPVTVQNDGDVVIMSGSSLYRRSSEDFTSLAHYSGFGGLSAGVARSDDNLYVTSQNYLYLRNADDLTGMTLNVSTAFDQITALRLLPDDGLVVIDGNIRSYSLDGDTLTQTGGLGGGAVPGTITDAAVQSDGQIAMMTDQYLYLREMNISDGVTYAGPFAGLTRIAVRSDDHLIVASNSGGRYAFLRDADTLENLATIDLSTDISGNITALAVQSDNDLLVGTDAGELLLVAADFSEVLHSQTGFHNITGLAIAVPEPSLIVMLLGGVCLFSLLPLRRCS